MNSFYIKISKLHFDDETSGYIPQMGDLIQSDFDKKIYEITEVKEEDMMHLLDKRYTWSCYVKPMTLENLSLSANIVSASPIAKHINKLKDLLDATDDIDIQKEDILYQPTDSEKPKNDPFVGW